MGTTEMILVLGLIVLFFGANKVSELAKNVAEGITYLKESFNDKEKGGRNN